MQSKCDLIMEQGFGNNIDTQPTQGCLGARAALCQVSTWETARRLLVLVTAAVSEGRP